MKRTAIAAAVLMVCSTANAEGNYFQLDVGSTFANQFDSSDGYTARVSYGNGFRVGLGLVSDQTVLSRAYEKCFPFDRGYGYTGTWCYDVPEFEFKQDAYAFLFGQYQFKLRQDYDFRPIFSAGMSLQEKQGHILSSNYSFMTGVGFEYKSLRVTWTHLSNAGLEGANWGQDFLTIGYSFQ